jgi:hypothetical protein
MVELSARAESPIVKDRLTKMDSKGIAGSTPWDLDLDHMRVVPDHRISGMVTYPLDEILLATLAGVVCGADDREGIEEIERGHGLAARLSAVRRWHA